jgi:hypothetical protein
MWSIESCLLTRAYAPVAAASGMKGMKGTIHKESAVFAMTISGFVLSCGALGKPKTQWSCYLLVACLVSRVEASTSRLCA